MDLNELKDLRKRWGTDKPATKPTKSSVPQELRNNWVTTNNYDGLVLTVGDKIKFLFTPPNSWSNNARFTISYP